MGRGDNRKTRLVRRRKAMKRKKENFRKKMEDLGVWEKVVESRMKPKDKPA